MCFFGLFRAKMNKIGIQHPKLIVTNDYQQFLAQFEWFLALFQISEYLKVQNKSNNTQSDAALITSLEWMQNALNNNKTIEKNILQELTDRYNILIEIVPDHLKAARVASRGIGFLNHFVCINVAKVHLVV